MDDAPQTLLAIDLGLRAGFAVFDDCGELVSYRSTHFPSYAAMKKAAWGVLRGVDGLAHVVVEGDKNLAALWRKPAEKQGLLFESVTPETGREVLLLPRQRRDSATAKRAADELAARLIANSPAPAPTGTLTSDVAEAILIGAWAALELGWRDPH